MNASPAPDPPPPQDGPPLALPRLLSPQEADRLHDTRRWRWIASIGGERVRPCRHPEHERRMRETKPAACRPAHREVRLMLSGESVYGFNGKVYRITPGTVLLFDHHETRGWQRAPYMRNFRALWLHFTDRDRVRYHTHERDGEGRCRREVLDGSAPPGSARRIMEVWDHCVAAPEDRIAWALLKSLLSATLFELLATAAPAPRGGRHRAIIASVEEHIRAHPGDDLRLETLAALAGYSPYFLHRLFLKHTGRTPRDYVNDLRLERARELLRRNYTVEAVAAAIGMSPSYFNRFFKERMRHTPRRWSDLDRQPGEA